MKFYLSLLLSVCILFSESVKGQDIFMSIEQKYSFTSGSFDIVGRSGNLIYTYRSTNNDYYLDAYNDSMMLVANIALDFFPKEVDEVEFLTHNDKIIVLYRFNERGNVVVNGAILDNKGMLIGKPIQLEKEKQAFLTSEKNYYEIINSKDKNKIGIISKNGKSNDSEFTISIYDAQLNKESSKHIKLSKEDVNDRVLMEATQLSNVGTMIIPTISVTNNGIIKSASLIKINSEGESYKKIQLNEADFYISDFSYEIDNETNKTHIAGFYNGKRRSNPEGTFYQVVNLQNNQIEKNIQQPFPEAFLKSVDEKKWKTVMNNYKSTNLVIKKDGGFVFIAEHQTYSIRNQYNGGFYGYDVFHGSPGFGNNVREYHFNDIVIMNFNDEGILMWSENVRKNQYTMEDGGLFSSYAFLNTGGNLVLLYNNLNSNDHSISVAAIDNVGKLQLARLNQLDRNADWVMRFGTPTGLKEIIIPVIKRDNLAFARVVF